MSVAFPGCDVVLKGKKGPTALCRGTPVLAGPLYTCGRGNAKGTRVAGRGTGEPDAEVGGGA